MGMASPCRTRGLRPRRGFAAAARLGEWLWKDPCALTSANNRGQHPTRRPEAG